jgi:hypothetical protein
MPLAGTVTVTPLRHTETGPGNLNQFKLGPIAGGLAAARAGELELDSSSSLLASAVTSTASHNHGAWSPSRTRIMAQ